MTRKRLAEASDDISACLLRYFTSSCMNLTINNYKYRQSPVTFKPTFHLTISMRGERAAGKIQRNNYHHGSCGPSLTGKTMTVFFIFTQGTHRNVKNR